MRKIPTLFKRVYENGKVVGITDKVTEGFEWVLNGEGDATVKYDGACCAIINGELYKRYDAKRGKTPPEGAIPCQEAPDPVTGHFPHWVKCDRSKPEDKWFWAAYDKGCLIPLVYNRALPDGTYEAVGKHFQGNPYAAEWDFLVMHGKRVICASLRSFEDIRDYLKEHCIEGIVFWKDGEPQCKIKRTDFGFPWGIGGKNENS